jgi:hypothetical protein
MVLLVSETNFVPHLYREVTASTAKPNNIEVRGIIDHTEIAQIVTTELRSSETSWDTVGRRENRQLPGD